MTDEKGRPALEAARGRIKALLETVRQLEEARGAALLRVSVLEGRIGTLEARPVAGGSVAGGSVIEDDVFARALVGAMPRHAKRAVSCRVLAVMLCLTKGTRSVNELRALLGVAQATASEWLQEAVGVGVVSLVADEDDKRRHVAQLTAKGHVYVRDRRGREAGATNP